MNFIVTYDKQGSEKSKNAKSKIVAANSWQDAKEKVEKSGNIVNTVVSVLTGSIEYEKALQ